MSLATSLKAKLLAGFAAVLALLLLMAGLAMWQIRKADRAADEIATNYLPSIESLGQMNAEANKQRRLLYAFIAAPPELKQQTELAISASVAAFVEHMEAYAKMDMDIEERKILGDVQTAWPTLLAANGPILAASRANDHAGAIKGVVDSRAEAERIMAAVEKLITINEGEAAKAKIVQDDAVSSAYRIIGIATAISLVAGVIIALKLATSIVTPVTEVGTVLTGLAAGDLTKRATVSSRDEVGVMAGTLNTTMDGLRGMVGGISQNAQGIAGAAEELSAVSKQLTGNAETSANQSSLAATAATEISASISTFAAGVEEMGVTVSEIAKSASQAASVAQEGVAAAEDANTAMTRLGTSSNEIGDIVKVITSIAEQTNLLALNATIEAARAGDAGRGFAVVASEVKDLARKTSEATADIGKRVSGIQGDSKAAQAALSRITDIVGKINDLQQTIATAVEEQSATNKELAGNIGQVAQAGTEISANVNAVAGAAKEAATGAGETLKAANELAKLAADLRQAVARFRT